MRSVFKRTGGLANMERDRLRLRRVLVRFNKDELVHVVRKLGVEVNDRATKAQLVAHGLQHFLVSVKCLWLLVQLVTCMFYYSDIRYNIEAGYH